MGRNTIGLIMVDCNKSALSDLTGFCDFTESVESKLHNTLSLFIPSNPFARDTFNKELLFLFPALEELCVRLLAVVGLFISVEKAELGDCLSSKRCGNLKESGDLRMELALFGELYSLICRT